LGKKKFLQKTILVLIIGCNAVVAYFIISALFSTFINSGSRLFDLLVFSAVLLIVLSLKDYLYRFVEKYFCPAESDYKKSILEFVRTLSLTLDPDELITKLLTRLTKIMGLAKAVLYLETYEQEKIKIYELGNTEEGVIISRIPEKDDPFFNLLTGQEAIKTDEFMIKYYMKIRNALEEHQISLSLPLIVSNRLVGILNLWNTSYEKEFTPEEIFLLETVSTQASIAIDNALTYKRLERAYRELSETQEELIKAEKLSAVGKITSSIIHDIKNPLTNIMGFSQLTSLKTEDKILKQYAENIFYSAEQMLNMVKEILDFVKGKETELSLAPYKLEEVVSKTVEDLKSYLEHNNIELKVMQKFKKNVYLDKFKITRVLYNIIKNAAESMPEGGVLTIRTFSENNKALISVNDTGTGMSEEVRDKIFNPFFTNGKKTGTGLGLSIVRKIIEAHKGKIKVDSEKGKGTTFLISLPVQPSVKKQPSAKKQF